MITDSIINKEVKFKELQESDGTRHKVVDEQPEQVLAIRYKHIVKTTEDMYGEEEYDFEKVVARNGQELPIDAEYYSYTGSKVLIDQARKDFSHEDLPCPTVIQEFVTDRGKKFFKFT